MTITDHPTATGGGRSPALLAVALLGAVALALLLLPDAALAVRDVGGGGGSGKGTGSVNAEAAGQNLANLLKGIAQPVLYVIAAICGIGAVLRHQYMLIIGLIAGCMLITLLLIDAGTGAIEAMANEFAKALGG
ncbi:MAG TPA: hypothetical protein VLK58_01625 [Conexibacter sp.]|nr:hypothetical protein [Conexibacter sp.]